MSTDAGDLQAALIGFVRAFGLLQPDRTPCGLELHVSDAHAIAELSAHGPMTQQALADRLCLRKSTVSRLIGNLAARGWVARAGDPGDGRAQIVSLTPEGLDVAGRVNRARSRRFGEMLDALTPSERRQVVESVKLLTLAATSTSTTESPVST